MWITACTSSSTAPSASTVRATRCDQDQPDAAPPRPPRDAERTPGSAAGLPCGRSPTICDRAERALRSLDAREPRSLRHITRATALDVRESRAPGTGDPRSSPRPPDDGPRAEPHLRGAHVGAADPGLAPTAGARDTAMERRWADVPECAPPRRRAHR